MSKKVSIRQHWRDVWDIFFTHGLYLSSLNFLLVIQALFFGGTLLLCYFGSVPWYLTLAAGLLVVGFFNLSLTGVSKNLFALARGRGPGKYPIFHHSYWWLGLPVLLSFLHVAVVPLLVIVVLVLSLLGGLMDYWPVVLAATTFFYLVWQWSFGFAPALLLDQRLSIMAALQGSIELACRDKRATWSLLLIDQAILVVLSFVPIIGTIVAVNWIALSTYQLYWELQ